MWVTYEDNLWVCHAGFVALVLYLYAAKAGVLRLVVNPVLAALLFSAAASLCVPAMWALSPDWDNEHVSPMGIYVGGPGPGRSGRLVPDRPGPQGVGSARRLVLAGPAGDSIRRARVGVLLGVDGGVRAPVGVGLNNTSRRRGARKPE